MLSLLSRLSLSHPPPTARAPLRLFTISAVLAGKSLPPRPQPPPESEIREAFVKGSGPGGQKINKTSSACQIKHIPTGIVVKSQASRSRDQNRKTARKILAQRIDEHLNGDQSRSAIVGRIKKKKHDSAEKKSRRKYRKLAEEKEALNAGQQAVSDTGQPKQTAPSQSEPSQSPQTSDTSPSVKKP